jgi:uncharacterized protein YoxC
MPNDNAAEFDYNIRKYTHVIGLHTELMEGLREEVKSIMDKEKKTPEDFKRYLDALDKIIEESAKLQKSSKELTEYIRDRRLKQESEKNDEAALNIRGS